MLGLSGGHHKVNCVLGHRGVHIDVVGQALESFEVLRGHDLFRHRHVSADSAHDLHLFGRARVAAR